MDDSFQDSGDTHDGGNRRQTNRRASDNAEPLTVTIEPSSKKQYSYEAKQYRLDRTRYRLEKKAYCAAHWTMTFLIIYTGLTLIVAVMSIITGFAAKESADTAARQLEMTDRPWVAVDVSITSPLAYNDKGVEVEFSFTPKNIGHSPAQNVLIDPQLLPIFMGDDVREIQKNICDSAAKAQSRMPRYVLFPEEPYTQPFGLSMSSESIIAHWGKQPPGMGQPDPIPIALVGCVDYTYETSRRHHQTGFAIDVLMKDGRLPLRSLTPLAPSSLILRQHPEGGHIAN
jgi:hypothetical protein